MSDLGATIERLRALDSKRTPGSWHAIRDFDAERRLSPYEPISERYMGVQMAGSGGFVIHPDANRDGNSRFIAAAPEMMAVINALVTERDDLQAENARLMQTHMDAGIRAGELTAKLIDAERIVQRTRERANKHG